MLGIIFAAVIIFTICAFRLRRLWRLPLAGRRLTNDNGRRKRRAQIPIEDLTDKTNRSLAHTVPDPLRRQARVIHLLAALFVVWGCAACVKQDGRLRLTPEGRQIAAESGFLALDIAARLGEHLIERLATTGTAGTAKDWQKIALDLVPESGPKVLAQIIRAAKAQWDADHPERAAPGVSRSSVASSPVAGTRLERHAVIGFRPDTAELAPAVGVVLDDDRVSEALRYLSTVYH